VASFPQYLALAGEEVPAGQRQQAMGAVESWTSLGGIVGPILGSFLLLGSLYAPFLGMALVAGGALTVAAFSPVLPHGRRPATGSDADSASRAALFGPGRHAFLGGFLVMGLMVATQTFVGSFARDQLLASQWVQGLITTLLPAAMTVGSLAVSVAQGSHQAGHRTVLLAAGSALVGMLVWALSSSLWAAAAGLALIGAGLGVWLPIVDHDVSHSSTDATRGTRLALLHTSKTGGILLAPTLAGFLIDNLKDYRLAFLTLLVLAAGLAGISIQGRRREPTVAAGAASAKGGEPTTKP
jgi:MFS family permease